jgi:hypothetical protein
VPSSKVLPAIIYKKYELQFRNPIHNDERPAQTGRFLFAWEFSNNFDWPNDAGSAAVPRQNRAKDQLLGEWGFAGRGQTATQALRDSVTSSLCSGQSALRILGADRCRQAPALLQHGESW